MADNFDSREEGRVLHLRTRRRVAVLVGAATVGVLTLGAWMGLAATGDRPAPPTPVAITNPIDPQSLALPPSVARPPWVDEDGVVDEARMPPPPTHDPWLREDGSVDCTKVSRTIGIVAQDGRLILDSEGKQVQIPNLYLPAGCGPEPSVALQQAWMERANSIARDDAARRGLPAPSVPKVEPGVAKTP